MARFLQRGCGNRTTTIDQELEKKENLQKNDDINGKNQKN